MYAVLGAMNEEIDDLLSRTVDLNTSTRLGIEIHHGTLNGTDVLIARSGVGKVNAALAAAALASVGATAIIFTGVAGGVAPELSVGDVVIATDLVQHDVDVTAMGFAPGQLLGEPAAWLADPQLSEYLVDAAREVVSDETSVLQARIASGDQFIASAQQLSFIRDTFNAAATEMEGAAVAQVCNAVGIRCAVLRVISDTADHDAPQDFPTFLRQAARIGADTVLAALANLPKITDQGCIGE